MSVRWRDWSLVALVIGLAFGAAWALLQRRESLDERIAVEMKALTKPGDILMLASASCEMCGPARRWFESAQVPVQECRIDQDPACQQRYQSLGGMGLPVFVVRGKPVYGWERDKLLALLKP